MEFNLEQAIEKIKSHPLFLKLKDVIEHSEGYHDHEDTYSHSVKTAQTALTSRDGNFITNPDARKQFKEFMSEKVYDVSRQDIVVLTALLHDCGKLLSFKENGKVFPMCTIKPGTSDQTIFPGHEYWGGQFVAGKILEDIGIEQNLSIFISRMVELHSVLNDASYYTAREKWPIEALVANVKTLAEGRYIEGLFNAYCDCFNANAFIASKAKITELFNTPSLYHKREYYIA